MTDHYADILEQLVATPVGRGWDGYCPIGYRHRNLDRNPSLRLWVGERGELVCRCMGCGASWGEIVRATGTAPRDWWPQESNTYQPRRRPMGKIVATYDYRDASGRLYAQKLRREPGTNGEGKSFSWRRPLPQEFRAENGVGPEEDAWVWGLEEGIYAPHEGNVRDWRFCRLMASQPPAKALQLPLQPAGLYRLSNLIAEPVGNPCVIVEGEKKANALFALGLCAMSGPNGARAWNADWAAHFRGRKVIVIPDNNAIGLHHASVVAGSLLLHGAAALKLIEPGELWAIGEGEDIGDWLLRCHAKEQRKELSSLFARFPAYTPIHKKAAVAA